MSELLIEIGVEEIPASYLEPAVSAWQAQMAKDLAAFAAAATWDVYYTPRRLALRARGVLAQIAASEQELMGPPLRIAYKDGKPTPALDGFCRKAGVTLEQLYQIEQGGETKLAAKQVQAARSLADTLVAELPRWIAAIPFPKAMRWESTGMRFARPIRTLIVLLDGVVVPVTVAGVGAGNQSRVHRFDGAGQVAVSASSYDEVLAKHHILASHDARVARIREQAEAICTRKGYAVADLARYEGLVHEIADLVEWPTVLVGTFDTDFLALPPEVIEAPLVKHQRYIPLRFADGRSSHEFLFVSNSLSTRDELIREGNSRVVRARLADALFFWNEDQKHKLADRIPKLGGIVFHNKIGTYGDKLNVQAALVPAVARATGVPEAELSRATELAYADLVTAMVYEFPELGGTMGRDYATRDGEAAAVVASLDDGLKPKQAGDALPDTALGRARSLLSRLETLVAFFAANEKPTGSKDPYALRRAAIGLCRVAAMQPAIDLQPLIEMTAAIYSQRLGHDAHAQAALVAELAEFLATRWEKECQKEQNLPTGPLRATTLALPFDPARSLARAQALSQAGDGLQALLDGYKRIVNVMGKDKAGELVATAYSRPEESALIQWLAVPVEDVSRALALVPLLEAYFTAVMVQDKDPGVRTRNISLLAACRAALDAYARFDQMIF